MLLAVVAESGATTRPQTQELGTRGTSTGYHHKTLEGLDGLDDLVGCCGGVVSFGGGVVSCPGGMRHQMKSSNLLAVGSRTPTSIRIGGENPTKHELLILGKEGRIVHQDGLDVIGMEDFRTFRTGDVDARLCDLNAQVLLHAVET